MITLECLFLLMPTLVRLSQPAVVAPPWARESSEPCGGWQEVRWRDDGRCYRIFQQGPCPETMELAYSTNLREAECRCPPRTAQWSRDAKCHQLYQRSPCRLGQYFAPVINTRWGSCLDPEIDCPEGALYWPRNGGKCYRQLTRGPCPIGELFIEEEEGSPIGICRCDNSSSLNQFQWITNTNACYEPFTRGPCGRGELVLPEPLSCGCKNDIPHYHRDSNECHELGTVGPCPAGHQFVHSPNSESATCQCKDHHVLWPPTGTCYREFTRGPCSSGAMLLPNMADGVNNTRCVSVPCPRGHLYLPEYGACFRAGTQGPCPLGKLVVFEDFIGVSYRGRCACSVSDFPTLAWDDGSECYEVGFQGPCPKGHVFGYGGVCHTLYTRGFCISPGQWLVPEGENRARCECRPGYGPGDGEEPCQTPLVALARFLSIARQF